jgi:hypothetical protein
MSDLEAKRMSAAEFAAYNQRKTSLKNQAEKNLGGTITQVAPNGDCLFLAIADQEGAGQERADELRALAMRTISEKCLTDYSDSIAGDDLDLPDATARERCDAYVAKYGKKGEYGGDLELRALQQALNVNIEVYRVTGQVTRYPDVPIVGPTYTLIFYGEGTYPHYDSIRFPSKITAGAMLAHAKQLLAQVSDSGLLSALLAAAMTGPAEAIEASAATPADARPPVARPPVARPPVDEPAGSPVDEPASSPVDEPASSPFVEPASSPVVRKKDQYKTWINKYKYNTIAAQVNDPTDPMLAKYIELEDEDAAKEQFRDRTILIDDEPVTILNPYKAAQYRGDPTITTWNSGSSFNSGEMFAADNAVVQKLVPNELLSDRRAVSAILESLWFCGTKQEIGSNPYCFPERYLGMLRKYGEGGSGSSASASASASVEEEEEAEEEEAEEAEEEEAGAEEEAEAELDVLLNEAEVNKKKQAELTARRASNSVRAPSDPKVRFETKEDAGLLRVKAAAAAKAARNPPP